MGENMRKEKSSTEFYNVIRVLATIFVVIGHGIAPGWNGDSGYIELIIENPSLAYTALYSGLCQLSSWIYGFHMPLFLRCQERCIHIPGISIHSSIVLCECVRLWKSGWVDRKAEN